MKVITELMIRETPLQHSKAGSNSAPCQMATICTITDTVALGLDDMAKIYIITMRNVIGGCKVFIVL